MAAPTGPAADLLWHEAGYEAVRRTASAFLRVAESLDEQTAQRRAPELAWTGREVVAHVVTVCRRYLNSRERAASAEDLARLNAAELEALQGTTEQLCAEISKLIEQMATLPARVPAGVPLLFHAGQQLPLSGGWGNLVGELLAHAHDLHALGAPLPAVDGADLEPLWRCTLRALGPWLTPLGATVQESWLVDIGFASGPVSLSLADGTISLDPGDGSPTYRLVGDAVDVTLVAVYHRRPLGPVPAAAHELATRIRDL